MAKFEESKYFIAKREDLIKYLDQDEIEDFNYLAHKIVRGRTKAGLVQNSYVICNQDEPYSQKVVDVIIEGETVKETLANQPNNFIN